MESIIQQNYLTLEILDLSGCTGITYESIQNISQMNNLSEINFSWTKSLIFHFNSEIIQYLVNNLPINLKKLSLRGQKMVQDEDVLCLVKRCQNINELDLFGTHNITNCSMDYIIEHLHTG